jgi:hypothetical protein
METVDRGEQEQPLFLSLAADAMKEYRAKRGEYPKEWHLLDFTFGYGPYLTTDPGVRPTKDDRNKWRPKDCDDTYVIRSADKDHFLIQAVSPDGVIEFEIDQSMEEPKRLCP